MSYGAFTGMATVMACVTCERMVLCSLADLTEDLTKYLSEREVSFVPTICKKCETTSTTLSGLRNKCVYENMIISSNMVGSWKAYILANELAGGSLSLAEDGYLITNRNMIINNSLAERCLRTVWMPNNPNGSLRVQSYLDSSFI